MRSWPIPVSLLAARAALGAWAIRAYSATFDEPELIAAGWSYWTQRDMRLDPMHPALALLWNALPLAGKGLALPDGPEWRNAVGAAFGERLLFWSGNDGDALLELARVPNLLLALAVGFLLWRRARRLWGDAAGAVALAFYCFSPVLLAHSSLATTDFMPAALAALTALALADFLRAPSPRAALLVGLGGAAAFVGKYSAAALAPALVLVLAFAPAGKASKAARARTMALCGVLPGLALLALVFAAAPRMYAGLLHHWRFVAEGVEVFLFGRIYPNGALWFPAAVLSVKSTFPELLVLGFGAALAWRKRLKVEPEVLVALAIAVSFAAMTALSRKQLGARYFLSVYATLPLIAGAVAGEALKRPREKALAFLLGAWQAACAFGAAPDFLPYFNEACGGAAGGHRCLGDSNLDWGQDLQRLGDYARAHGNPELILSYFGTASPETYGLRPQHLGTHSRIQRRWMNSDAPAKELLVVSRTNLQGIYAAPPGPPAWAEGLGEPERVGWSLLVYDVTSDASAHRRLAEAYAKAGDGPLAARERRRAGALERGRR